MTENVVAASESRRTFGGELERSPRAPALWLAAGRSARSIGVGLVGVGALVGAWYLATLFVSRTAIPLPQDVVSRIVDWFQTAPQLAS